MYFFKLSDLCQPPEILSFFSFSSSIHRRRVSRGFRTELHANQRGSDINALILDYLTMEGYPKAAANFSKEANLKPQQDKSFVHTRQQIQNSIHSGNIDDAITSLNHFNPEVSFSGLHLFLVSAIALFLFLLFALFFLPYRDDYKRFMHHS